MYSESVDFYHRFMYFLSILASICVIFQRLPAHAAHPRGLFGITWVGRLSRVLAVRAFLGLCRVSGCSFVVWSV